MENAIQALNEFAVTYGLSVVGAILILIVGRIVAGILRSVALRGFRKREVDETLALFFTRLVFITVRVFAVLAALAKFGVETASIVVVLGAVGFAFGFALQGSLSNFAAAMVSTKQSRAGRCIRMCLIYLAPFASTLLQTRLIWAQSKPAPGRSAQRISGGYCVVPNRFS